MGLMIHQATIADYDALHGVRMAVRENKLSDPSKVTFKDYASMLEGQGKGWVCEDDGRIAGFAIADLQTASIWALFVLPDSEGRGVGKLLHHTMLEWCFEKARLPGLRLSTDPGTRAEAFYRRAGWQAAGAEANGEIRFVLTKQQWLKQRRRENNPLKNSGGGSLKEGS
ncbi:GNAT family N-acetyltransferase [Cesiribacter sp. SM1]|uniref:GNAT family N-acetyltransferase n=1 Tax=Cesiribacter sp. SM1 TaxID=2861196 RepID=UPI001CD7EAF3|nr:GNAT family N-acetyltransferase [Cesiribacter sp. SM1]